MEFKESLVLRPYNIMYSGDKQKSFTLLVAIWTLNKVTIKFDDITASFCLKKLNENENETETEHGSQNSVAEMSKHFGTLKVF